MGSFPTDEFAATKLSRLRAIFNRLPGNGQSCRTPSLIQFESEAKLLIQKMIPPDLREGIACVTMPRVSSPGPTVRLFGSFEINLQTNELRKNGMRLRLSGQPSQVLAVLIEHAGELVTREELHSTLWKADTFVDFDHGLNNAVARIREVLDDSSGTPRYVETIPRRGYRFIAPLADVQPSIPVGLATEPATS